MEGVGDFMIGGSTIKNVDDLVQLAKKKEVLQAMLNTLIKDVYKRQKLCGVIDVSSF